MTTQDQDGEPTGSEQLRSSAALDLLRKLEALADAKMGLPITSHRKGPVAPLLVGLKKGFRLLFQVFINELMRKQSQFNDAAVNLFYVTYRDIQALQSSALSMRTGLRDRIRQLEEAVARLESQQAMDRKVDSTNSNPDSSRGSTEKN